MACQPPSVVDGHRLRRQFYHRGFSATNLAGRSAPRTTHVLLAIVRDTGTVLVHAHNRRIDHVHRRVMSTGEGVHDLIPNTSPAPTNEAVVADGMRTKALSGRSRHGAPGRKTHNMPLRIRRSSTRETPRGLFWSIGPMTLPSLVLRSTRCRGAVRLESRPAKSSRRRLA